jgi:hypothetical protein
VSVIDQIAGALEEWQVTGRPQAMPGRGVLSATVDGDTVLCPSYPAEGAHGVFAVVGEASTVWLGEVVPLGDRRLDGVPGVWRAAGPCVRSSCLNWDGGCQLGAIVTRAGRDEVSVELPPCPIRERCRWHLENGDTACRACPGLTREG